MTKLSKPVLSLVSALIGATVVLLAVQFSTLGQQEQPAPEMKIDPSPIARDAKGVSSYAPILKRAAPSVVNIFTTRTVRERQMHPFFDDPVFRRFFGDPGQRPREHKATSLGSGVIVSPNGYILTANHVIDGADEIRVAFATGGTEFTAKVVGADPPTDIAVLKVDSKELPAITIADSDQIEVGDVVLAIGNPFGVGQTVTQGIISGLGRALGITEYEDFIQTDAPINRGNSGGALVDAQGRLVGVNTAIFSPSGGNIGIGFAVPINMARRVMDSIIPEGRFARGYLGISLQPEITASLAKMFRMPDQRGAMIAGVQPNTPAEKAGLREGDVIRQVDGKPVADSGQLRLMISQTPPGSKVNLRVLRDGRERNIAVNLGELPDDRTAGRMRPPQEEREGVAGQDALAGVEITDLDTRTRRQFEVPANVRGALVMNVEQGSAAARAGIRPGDIIQSIGRKPVRDADEAVQLSQKIKDEQILLRIWRAGSSRFVVVENTREQQPQR
jgi:serine protease Do